MPALLEGAGFVVTGRPRRAGGRIEVDAYRDRTLPDFVGGGMRMLVCGLNPSVVAADAGFGYAGATNRFWSVAVAAGVVSRPRDPLASLDDDGLGMTDLVKRATPNADGLTAAEYEAGAERVRRLVEWLRPGVVVFVGLAGWRAAVDRRAVAGPQPAPFGGTPAYVMPSTSGRNARTSPAELPITSAGRGRSPGRGLRPGPPGWWPPDDGAAAAEDGVPARPGSSGPDHAEVAAPGPAEPQAASRPPSIRVSTGPDGTISTASAPNPTAAATGVWRHSHSCSSRSSWARRHETPSTVSSAKVAPIRIHVIWPSPLDGAPGGTHVRTDVREDCARWV